MPASFHPALCARAPFLNALLAYTDGDGWDAPIHVGDRLEVHDRQLDDVRVVDLVDGQPVVELEPGGERLQLSDDDYPCIIASPFATGIWEDHQRSATPDGVAWSDDLVPDGLRARLDACFDRLCTEWPVDHHPGSKGTVRDLIHPSLYPYVHGVTPLAPGVEPPADPDDAKAPKVDRWGRPFEASRFQWLPAEVQVDADGHPRFESRIEGSQQPMDRGDHGDVYAALEELLGVALPLFESTVGYAEAWDPWDHRADDCEADLPEPAAQQPPPQSVRPVSLRGRRLQVIPKLVQYEIGADTSFGGVWHVEGMSHEHLVATAVFVLQRDPALDGGALRFKRGYTRTEAGQVFWNINQMRPRPVDEMVDQDPLGTLETPEGRLFAFPNSHVHKLTPLTRGSAETDQAGGPAIRRIVVFWLVDPDVRLLSTADVPPQQTAIPLEQARAHRLELMEERRRHKQSHNVREISLCEH